MTSILKYLSDPGWWFTTVFVSLIISIVATYIPKLVDPYLSSWSLKYKNKREEQLKREQTYIDLMVSDQTYLILENIKLFGRAVLALLSLLLCALAIVAMSISKSDSVTIRTSTLFMIVFVLTKVLLSSYSIFKQAKNVLTARIKYKAKVKKSLEETL